MGFSFGCILVGDLFKTKTARYVKISGTEAIVVMSTINHIGTIHEFDSDFSITLLWSAIFRC